MGTFREWLFFCYNIIWHINHGEPEKQKIKFSLSQQHEWLQYFNEQKAKANNIQPIIQQTDKEIDAMVYALYGLSEEEVKIVEGIEWSLKGLNINNSEWNSGRNKKIETKTLKGFNKIEMSTYT